MVNEHDDDLEPEVDAGAEVETENYPGVIEDVDDKDRRGESGPSGDAGEDESADGDDEASDTI